MKLSARFEVIVERMEKFLALSVVVTTVIFAGGYAMAAMRGR